MAKHKYTIGTTTTSDEMKTIFERVKNGDAYAVLDDGSSRNDLMSLVRRAKDENVVADLVAMIVQHRSADEILMMELARLSSDSSVLNAIATSGKTPVSLLHELAHSEYADVRGHAELALLQDELTSATADRFRKVLSEHKLEGGIDIGVRMLLASHSRTPLDVLHELTRDDVDIVADAAETSLKVRSPFESRE